MNKLIIPKVEQFHSKNQFVIYDRKGNTIFQSYDSIIAIQDKHGNVILDENKWDYSTTTGKYRNKFLGDKSKAITAKRIKDGVYKLANLND